jgi:endonuclease V-like protein UPF0215 family
MKNIFKDKIVSFSTGDDFLGIMNPKFKTIHNKVLLVGTIPKGATTQDLAKNKSCAVSWRHVTDYIIFDSIDEYNNFMGKR